MKGVDLAVVAGLPALGQAGTDLNAARQEHDESVVDVARDVERLAVVLVAGIETDSVVAAGKYHGLLGTRCAFLLRSAATGEETQRRAEDQRAGQTGQNSP